jgi:hypothetical protein
LPVSTPMLLPVNQPTNLNYSTSCAPKYTTAFSVGAVGGYCQSCAANCFKCDINGPSNCDPSQCILGFAQLTGTLNCTACYNSCPVCDSNDLNMCLNCGPRRYSNGQSSCLNCPNGCQTCISASVCTACQSSYALVGSICLSSLNYPCAIINSNRQCSQCFQYYVLNGSNCVIDLSCNLNASCMGCPYGYYLLNSTCMQCTLQSHCLTCNSNNQCVLCYQGFFLSNGSCSQCKSDCKDCSSLTFCNQADDGYFLQYHSDGSNSGEVLACQGPCLSCQYNAKYCLTCINGYKI